MLRLIFTILLALSFCAGAQTVTGQSSPELRQVRNWLDSSWELRFRNPDSARHFGFLALEASRKLQEARYEAESLHNIGVIYEAQADYTRALEYSGKALELYQKLKEEQGIANANNNIGIVYDQLGDFPKALQYYNEAYTRFRAAGDIEKQALVSVNIGILFKAQKDYSKTINYYHDAYAVYRHLQLPAEIAFCEANLGSVYYYTLQYDSCLYYSLLAEKAFTKQQNLQFLPVALVNAAMAYFETGRKTKARDYFQRALEMHRSYNNPKEVAFVMIQLAKVHAGEKGYNEAIHLLEEAKLIAENVGASQQVMDASELLSEYYAETSAYRNAWLAYRHYSLIKDSLFEREKMRTIADYQTRYETDKKEQQITVLKQEADIRELKLRQRNYLLVSLFLLIALGILFAYFLLQRRKMKAEARIEQERQQQQEQATRSIMIAEERERRRIAEYLHDGVGQTLSAALLQMDRVSEQSALDNKTGVASKKVLSLLTESYDDIRSLSHRMIPKALLKRGLSDAVKELAGNLQGSKVNISLDIHGFDKERLPEEVETVLYRIIQEAVQNVIKHAGANTLSIQLVKDEEGIALNIEDDGKGFDTALLDNAGGMGMKNIFSRVALLKGTIEVNSSVGRGALISIFIP